MSHTMPEVWDTFSEGERQTIRRIIESADDAWRASDFTELKKLWEFGFVNGLSNRTPDASHWKKLMKAYSCMWTLWRSEIVSANTQNHVAVTTAANTFSWGRDRREVLRVVVKLNVGWNEEQKLETSASFFLRRKGKGYRTVHWECPFEEFRVARDARR